MLAIDIVEIDVLDENDQLVAAMHIELLVDMDDVRFDGVSGQIGLCCNRRNALAAQDVLEHFDFPRGKRICGCCTVDFLLHGGGQSGRAFGGSSAFGRDAVFEHCFGWEAGHQEEACKGDDVYDA